MKSKIIESAIFILHVLLTALASAGIALLQNYITSHGVDTGPALNPEHTALIGTGVATLVRGIKLA